MPYRTPPSLRPVEIGLPAARRAAVAVLVRRRCRGLGGLDVAIGIRRVARVRVVVVVRIMVVVVVRAVVVVVVVVRHGDLRHRHVVRAVMVAVQRAFVVVVVGVVVRVVGVVWVRVRVPRPAPALDEQDDARAEDGVEDVLCAGWLGGLLGSE